MAGIFLSGAVAVTLLVAWTADAEARGRRGGGSGRSTHHDTYIGPSPSVPSVGGTSRGTGSGASGAQPVAPPLACTPLAPCTTSGGHRYVTDPASGVSRFLPN